MTLAVASRSRPQSTRPDVRECQFPEPFANFSSEASEFLHGFCRKKTFQANAIVHFQDDPTEHLYFVKSGYVRLAHIHIDGSVTLCGIVPAGQTFGEAGAFEKFGYCYTASTITTSEIIVVNLKWINDTGSAANELRFALAKLISRRHRDQIDFTRAVGLPSLEARLSQSLVVLVDLLGNKIRHQGKSVVCLSPIVTQNDLGAMARGSRGNVNRFLKKWEDMGIVAVKDRHILVLDIERLDGIAFQATSS